MKTVAIIQARMGSTRLPGKVMKMLQDKTVLGHVITRVKACPLLDEVIVATTELTMDDVIVEESKKYGASFFRGSESDVLSRYYYAAKENCADIVVRVTSDCPLFDPDILTAMLRIFFEKLAHSEYIDYLSNGIKRTFPRGLDASIMTFSALERAFHEAAAKYEREHVTAYIYNHPEIFRIEIFTKTEDLSFHRWTLDTEEDFELISLIYQELYQKDKIFSTQLVLDLLKKSPEMVLINSEVKQKGLRD